MPRDFRGYEVQQKIGSGGMSTLYLGIHKALNKKVAIKILHPGLAEDEQFIARFEREARAASAVGHRNIVYVTDFGSEDDVYYIVMEYVPGKDLRAILSEVGRFPPEVGLALLEEVVYGLEAAHEQGVIHRDIKPSNVLLSTGGDVKIADFGLARQSADIARLSALTVPGSVLGTPAYMSPEQAAGKDVDHRTDIYSLGVMAYELLTGEKPYAGHSYSEIRDQIINREPAPLRGRAAVTPAIEALVLRCLEKDPDRRPQSARQLLRSIEECMEELDPSGALFKHRRRYLREFAVDPVRFTEELRHSSISSHLDRGFYFKRMGLSKISDAIREFRYVLFLDPDNERASSAVHELETEAEESGIRVPSAGASAAREERGGGGTRVLSSDEVSGATIVARGRGGGAPARWLRAHRGALLAAGGVAVAAVALFLLWPQGGPTGALAVESVPPGAAVSVRGPGQTEFEATGRRTDCVLENLQAGTWEVRLDLDGHRSQVRRIRIASGRELLRLNMEPAERDGRVEVTSVPPGATVAIRRAGETELRTLPGVTPLTTDPLPAGSWDLRVSGDGPGPVTRTLDVRGGRTASLAVDLAKDYDRGSVRVESDPPGGRIEVRRSGDSSFRATERTTPATLEDLAVGAWEVRVAKSGHRPEVRPVEVLRDQEAQVSLALAALQPASEKPGYVRVRVTPPADVYVDGSRVGKETGDLVVPIEAGKSHSVELRHATLGRKRFGDVRAASGDTLDLGRQEFAVVPIRVFCRPSVAAEVWLDGVKQERQTTFIGTVGAGRHHVRIRKAGYGIKEAMAISGGQSTRLTPGADGEVEIVAQPDQEIWVQFLVEKTP